MTRVKVCGITDPTEARVAAELGAWAIGLVFGGAGPRACPVEAGEEIGAEVKREVEVTGVFANATLDEVAGTAERCSLTVLQLEGDEGPAYCREAARRTGCKVMKAVRVTSAATVRGLRPFRVDYHLLDAHVPGTPGNADEFRWELVAAHDRSVPIVLSGGLTKANVAEAIATTRPFAVDTVTGTEAGPGRTDPAPLRAFFEAVAAASPADGAHAVR